MTDGRDSTIRRVLIWSLAVGSIASLLGVKAATTFETNELEAIGGLFAGGCMLGALLGLLTTAYNQRKRTLFHIWGWALLLGLCGLVFNTGTARGYLLGAGIGIAIGAFIGSMLYLRVARRVGASGVVTRV
jgi:hypothetical protein